MTRSSFRTVTARRLVATGATLAALAAPAAGQAESTGPVEAEGEGSASAVQRIEAEGESGTAEPRAVATPAEGESEGGGQGPGTELTFQRDLGFMAGHLEAGIALYRAGDIEAARTHMGHPIEEKYDALAETLDAQGLGAMREDLLALSAAAEEGLPLADIEALHEAVADRIAEARVATGTDARTRLLALAALTRIAAEEYDAAIEDGRVTDLHEYQDAWGFITVVKGLAGDLAGGMDQDQAAAAREVLDQALTLDAAFGDLKGGGIKVMDPSLIYAAAARMELAVLRLD